MSVRTDPGRRPDKTAVARARPRSVEPARKSPAPALEIGLLNNMPDSALQATERQFMRLVNAGADGMPVRLHFYSLPVVPRSAETRARMAGVYSDIAELGRVPLDGLIVTGTEPKAPTLRAEPYWDDLTRIVDWAGRHTLSTVWSCLAAHAAVLHLDGIERRFLGEKCSGMFPVASVADDPLLDGLAGSWPVSHSRWNGLDEADLLAAGYRVLTRAEGAGVDLFTRDGDSLFVFFQGHPEYDVDSIRREYRRDLGRFLAGERDAYPSLPAGYFDPATTAALEAFRQRAERFRDPALLLDLPAMTIRPELATAPADAAALLFRNWLRLVAELKADQDLLAAGAEP